MQELNSTASIEVETRSVEALPDSFFLNYDVILLTDMSEVRMMHLST